MDGEERQLGLPTAMPTNHPRSILASLRLGSESFGVDVDYCDAMGINLFHRPLVELYTRNTKYSIDPMEYAP